MLLLLAIIYVPFFQRAFGTFSLAPADWALTIALAFTVVPVLEVVEVDGAPRLVRRARVAA